MVLLLVVLLWASDVPLGESIVSFARSRLGQKVGDGECTSLAVQALRHCHAQRPDPVRGDWGDEVKALRDIQAGDILQFENALFVKQHVREDGAILTQTTSYPHHTAIVARVRKRGPRPVLVVLHQNAGVAGGDLVEQGLRKRRPRGQGVRPRRSQAAGLRDLRQPLRASLIPETTCAWNERMAGRGHITVPELAAGALVERTVKSALGG